MKNGERAVAQQMHVQLRAVSVPDGAAKGRKGVFRYAVGAAMQPAVGVAPMLQRRPARMVGTAVEKKELDGEQKQCEKDNEL